MKKEYSALDLFGGKNAVLGSMKQLTRGALLNISTKELMMLEEGLNLPIGYMQDILENRRKVNPEFFRKAGCSIGLSLFKLLGRPTYKNTRIKDYWVNDRRINQMGIASLPGSKLPLEMHVSFRAFEELCESYTRRAYAVNDAAA